MRTRIFLLVWSLWTILYLCLAWPCLFSRRATWWGNHRWIRVSLWLLKSIGGIDSRVVGREHYRTPSLIAAQHQSTWDTLILMRECYNPVFVLKKELYYIPIFGWYLWRSGQIAINRKARREALGLVTQQAKDYLAQGRTVVIFPEGTRVPVGEELPYQSGIARVSQSLAAPVLPASLNAGLFWPKKGGFTGRGTAEIRFHPPLEACGKDRHGWMAQLEAVMRSPC